MATQLPRITITLTPDTYALLAHLSKIHRCSKSKVLERMLQQSLLIAKQLLEADIDAQGAGNE